MSDLLAPDVPVAVGDFVRRAGRSIEQAQGRPFRGEVCAALVNHALTASSVQLERHLEAISDRAGVHVEPLSSVAELAAAGRQLGLLQPGDDPLAVLPADRCAGAVMLLAAFRTAQVRDWLVSGAATELLTSTWDAVDDTDGVLAAPGALDLTIAAHTGAGIDAERLAWDVILAETGNQLGLVWLEAHKLAPRYPAVTAEDLVGFGWQGLRAALRSYDPAVAAFSTYACPRINGAIRDGLRAEQPIPKRLTTLVNKVARAEEALTHSLGRAPELRELAERVGESLEKMALLPRLAATASVDELTGQEDGDRDIVPSWLADSVDLEEGAVAALRQEAVAAALGQLADDEADAVRLLLLEGLTPGEAAAQLGTTTRKLRASKNRGLEQLAGLLADWAPSVAA